MLSVGGGLPQGLPGERGQTTVAQRLDADQVSVSPVTPESWFSNNKKESPQKLVFCAPLRFKTLVKIRLN